MQLNTRKLLEDLRVACERVATFSEGRSLEDFRGDPLLRSAILRQLTLAGEAVRRLLEKDSATAESLPKFRRWINLAHATRHDDSLVDEIPWEMVRRDLGEMQEKVEELVKSS